MTAEEAIEIIELEIQNVKKHNQEMIYVDALTKYLSVLKEDAKKTSVFDQKKFENNLAIFRIEHERNLAHYNVQHQYGLEMFRSVITLGQTALKSAMLINGGAAVALLAFIGNIWTKSTVPPAVNSLTKAIAFFAFGVVAAAIGTGTTYVTQYFYSGKWGKTAISFHILTILFVLAAYALFCLGSSDVYTAFVKHLAPQK